MIRQPRGKAETERLYALALIAVAIPVGLIVGLFPLVFNDPHAARQTIVTILIGVAAVALAALVVVRMVPGWQRLNLLGLAGEIAGGGLEAEPPAKERAVRARALDEPEKGGEEPTEPGLKLARVDLREAALPEVDLKNADMTQAILSDADLRKATLERSDLAEATLQRANLKQAKLGGSVLVGASLDGANLAGADLSDTNLHGASLDGTDLRGVDLSGAKGLLDSSLRGAVFDDKTTWPISPMKARALGAVHVEDPS